MLLGLCHWRISAQSPETIIHIVKDAYGGNYSSSASSSSSDSRNNAGSSNSREVRNNQSSSERTHYFYGKDDPEIIIHIVKKAYAGDFSTNYPDQGIDTYRPAVQKTQPATHCDEEMKSSANTSAGDELDLSLQTPKLTQIPDEVFNRTELRILDVGYNRIKSIPTRILNLSRLEVLVLSGNQYLSELPDFLGEMRSLKTIYLEGMGTWSEQKKLSTVDRFRSKGIAVIVN
jgi:hypothetical protein